MFWEWLTNVIHIGYCGHGQILICPWIIFPEKLDFMEVTMELFSIDKKYSLSLIISNIINRYS
ncbi:hypothetical protein DHC50_03085 [Arenibacter sp. A80]|nr:hypothetical protein [Arenibacter sp. A80]RFT58151.1 hypothetical protein D0S24_03085 [Arenibacter sp. P308M17]